MRKRIIILQIQIITKTSDRPDKSGAFVDDISLSQGTCVESDWFGGPEPPVITLPTQPGPTQPTKPVATEPPPGPEVEGYEMEVGDCLEYVHSSGHASVETCTKWCNPDPNCKSFTYRADRGHVCHFKSSICANVQESDDTVYTYRKTGERFFSLFVVDNVF